MSKIKKILIAFSILLLLYSLYSAATIFLGDYAEQQRMRELAEVWNKGSKTSEGAAAPSLVINKANGSAMLPEFQELYQRNPDITGWLRIDSTRIDYPVMQNRQDAQFYLNHDFDKKTSKNGLPFLDIHSSDSNILLIHAHHMKSGMMFAGLMKYKEESYYKEHATFEYSTLYEKEEYEIVAVILSQVYRKSDNVFKYYQIEKAGTPAGFDSYIQNIKKLALYDTGVTPRYGDKLIVLSTCEYSTENGRLAVVARKRAR
ncbi:class B sortase [Paenibacillus tuaregi]|uniref:class B sortase n=1 Tax=Paenibacillus tuaregi TaxID=1816681 RepID=UPI0008382ECE|nr:class B sortase [Paenibacillus tuaregi]